MTEDASTQQTQDMPAAGAQEHDGQSPWDAHAASEGAPDPLPLAGAAFVGGFVLAKILKKLGGGDE